MGQVAHESLPDSEEYCYLLLIIILLPSSVIMHTLQCQVHINHALVILAIVKRTMVKYIVCQPHMNCDGTGSE